MAQAKLKPIALLILSLLLSADRATALDCLNPQTKVVRQDASGSCQLGERQMAPTEASPKPSQIPTTGGDAYPMRHVELENIARVLAYAGGRATSATDPRTFPGMAENGDVFDRTTQKVDALTGQGDLLAPMTQKGDPEFRKRLAASGPNGGYTLIDSIDDKTKTGMQAMVLRDATGQTFIAFRGTEPIADRPGTFSLGPDAVADLDHEGNVGIAQYDAFRSKLSQWADLYPNSYVTGHSLGAALAEHYISDYPLAVKEAVLFNVPAVSDEIAGRLGPWPPTTLYMGRNDLVSDLGGTNHPPARIVEVTQPGSGDRYTLADHSFTMLVPGNRFDQLDYYDYEARRVTDYDHVRSSLLQAFGATAGGILADYAPRSPKLPTRDMVDAANAQSREGRKILEYEIADRLQAMRSLVPAAQPALQLPPLSHPPVKTSSTGSTTATAATALVVAQAGCAATTKGSSAQQNQAGKFDCVCPDGQGPNADNSSCIPVNGGGVAAGPNADQQQKVICQGITQGSQPRRNADGKFDCVCPDGKEANADNSACVAAKVVALPPKPLSCDGLRGSHLITRTDGSPWCACPDGQVVTPDGTGCVSKKEAGLAAARATCLQGYPGSQPLWSDQSQQWNCDCPQGTIWNDDQTRCVDQLQAAVQWCASQVGPNSWPNFANRSGGAYECFCNDGFAYDGTACVAAAADAGLVTAAPGTFGHTGDPGGLIAALAGARGVQAPIAAPAGAGPNPINTAPAGNRRPDPAEQSACSQAVQYMASRGCSFAEVAGDMGTNGANCGPTALFIRPHSGQTRFVPKGPNCIWHDCYDIDQACAAMISECSGSNRFPCR